MSNSDYRLDSSKSTRFTKMVDRTRYLTATDTAASNVVFSFLLSICTYHLQAGAGHLLDLPHITRAALLKNGMLSLYSIYRILS